MRNDLRKNHENREFSALKYLLFVSVICGGLLLLMSCTTNEKEDERTCFAKCKKCEEVYLSCTDRKQHDTSEINPSTG